MLIDFISIIQATHFRKRKYDLILSVQNEPLYSTLNLNNENDLEREGEDG